MNTDGSQFRCPYCGSNLPPSTVSKVSSAGWVFFWVLLLFLCFPLFWIGLLIKDHFSMCSACGMVLGQALPSLRREGNHAMLRRVAMFAAFVIPVAVICFIVIAIINTR